MKAAKLEILDERSGPFLGFLVPRGHICTYFLAMLVHRFSVHGAQEIVDRFQIIE